MPRHVEAEERGEPEERGEGDGGEQELRVVEEGKGVVAEKRNNEVVVEGEKVEGVGEEEGEPGWWGG